MQAGLAGDVLLTRPVGERFRPVLEALLRDGAEADGVVLSFAGVALIDSSFADEVFGVLTAQRARRKGPRACLALRNLGPDSSDNLESALISRPVREPGLRNCVLPLLGADGRVGLVGKVEANVAETFELLRARVVLTARDLADERRLEIGAASTRLKALSDLGLAVRAETRDAHGKLFAYRWPW